MAPKILAFAGSTRKDSLNKKLIKVVAGALEKAGAQVTVIDLKNFPLPLYDGDLEAKDGLPAKAKELRGMMKAHDGLLISSPEYNSSITAVLKNAIDWASRNEKGEGSLDCFEGKVAALLSASPGNLGGLRGLVHLRSILGNIKVLVLPDQVAVPQANEAFDEAGSLKDPKMRRSVEDVATGLVKILEKLKK